MAKKPYSKDGMFQGASPLVFGLAKKLRDDMTDAEKVLWYHLKQKPHNLKFRRQHPLGVYIADFYCHQLKLVIEIDGSVHLLEDVKSSDSVRQQAIEKEGITVLRFTNNEVLQAIDLVLQRINDYLTTK